MFDQVVCEGIVDVSVPEMVAVVRKFLDENLLDSSFRIGGIHADAHINETVCNDFAFFHFIRSNCLLEQKEIA